MSSHIPAEVQAVIAAAVPCLRIVGVKRQDWCRVMLDPDDGRIGPWRYEAVFEELPGANWGREGEVLYFVTDCTGALRMVGQSSGRLKSRWRTSPMFNTVTREPLGRRALFHTTAWPAIERAIDAGEKPPFTVSAIFRPELQAVCEREKGVLSRALAMPETKTLRLAYHVESEVCALAGIGMTLWNSAKTGHRTRRPA